MNEQLCDELESLVDSHSVQEILECLSEVCGRKAEHVLTNWQDASLARIWQWNEGVIGVASTNIKPTH